MRKSWVALCLGTCVLAAAASCSDAAGTGGGNDNAAAGEAGQPSGGNGHAGSSAKAGSSSGGAAGGETTGGAAGAGLGGAPGAAGQLGDAGQPSSGAAAGGDANVGGSRGGDTALGGASAGESGGGVPSGSGGAAGAGGDGSGTPNCDDMKPDTLDFYNQLYGCGHETDTVPGGSDGWIWYDAGFYFDERTGAAWSPIDTSLSLDNAIKYCDALVIGKLSDFKVPTIDEVRASFAGGCEYTQPGSDCPIHDPDHLSTTEIYQKCSSCIGSLNSRYCPDNTPFCSWIKTTSLCSDCAVSKAWMYGPGNGNFAAIETAYPFDVSCILPDLPGAMP